MATLQQTVRPTPPNGFQIDQEDSDSSPQPPDGFQIDSQSSPTQGMFGPLANTSSQESSDNNAPGGLTGAGIEFGRGFEKGTGQLISDVGFLTQPIGGKGIQQFGNELINKANNIPPTQYQGFSKGALNFAGELAPTLATFEGGEAMGLAKLGEGGVKLLSSAIESPRIASLMTKLIRPMGQATLFGVTNAINTASTLPEAMDFNQKVSEISQSGKVGFITGAVMTPILDKGLDVLRSQGSNAFKAFMIGMTGSPKAAEDALDLTRKQGSYQRIVVDPSKPLDQRISFETSMAKDFSPAQREEIHNQILSQQDAEIQQTKDAHQQIQRNLEDSISQQNQQFGIASKQAEQEINDAYKVKQGEANSQIEQNISKVAQANDAKLDNLNQANTQQLNTSVQAFSQHLENTATLLNSTKDMLYASVSKNDPAGGFNVDGIISKIKNFLKSSYNIDLVKASQDPYAQATGGQITASDLEKVPSNQIQILGGKTRPSVWEARANNTAGKISPEAAKVVKFLTGEGGYLSQLENLKQTNDGKLSLDMLREDSHLIKGMSYGENGAVDSGLAQLDYTIRPNRLIGNPLNLQEKGLWQGADNSLASLKEAAIHDKALSDLLEKKKLIDSEFVGNKEFTGNATPKVKALLGNKEGYRNLRMFEDSTGLESNSPIRLTNSFQNYSDTSDMIANNRKRLADALSNATNNQKATVARQLNEIKSGQLSDIINKKYANKEAIIAQKRAAVDSKVADIRKAEAFKDTLKEKIKLENDARVQALNENSTLGSYSTALGKVQRGALLGSFWNGLSMSPHVPLTLGVAAALTPRVAIGGARALKGFMESGVGKAMDTGINKLATNPTAQKAAITSILMASRRRRQG